MLRLLQASALHFLHWNHERIVRCVEQLPEDKIWHRPNNNSLSVGNQLLHLEGNIRQWAVHGLGGRPDVRKRQGEFDAEGGLSAAELLARFAEVVEEAAFVISDLTEQSLLEERNVQAYRHDGVFVLLHVVEHLSYHTGQIVFYTKAVLNVDLAFYGDVDLGKTTNKP